MTRLVGIVFVSCLVFAVQTTSVRAAVATDKDCTTAGGTCMPAPGSCGLSSFLENIGSCTEIGSSCCRMKPKTPAAATTTPALSTSPRIVSLPDPLGGADIPTVIGRVIKTFLGLVGAIALVVFVYAGFLYLTAAGREDAIRTSKEAMKNAFIGLVVIFFSYAITTFFFKALTS